MVSLRGRRSLWITTAAALVAAATWTVVRERAGPHPLLKAQPKRGTIEAHGEHRYALALAQRECAFGSLKPWAGPGPASQPASDLVLTLRAPQSLAERAAKVLRRFSLREAGIDFGFCAQDAGNYELDVQAAERAGGYELALERVLARDAQKAKQPKPPENSMSPLLRGRLPELREPAGRERFWAETGRAGTPLIEPAEADLSWVTFLYRGSTLTQEVSVEWQLWSGELAQTQLAHLPGTDVWWRSLRLPDATRASYQLAIDPPLVNEPDSPWAERALAAVAQADPLNRQPMLLDPEVDIFAQRSVLQLPAAAPERWLNPNPKPKPGRLERQRMFSEKLGHEHALTVYLPAGYDKAHAQVFPLLIFFDGEDYLRLIAAPRLLDALIAAQAITPVVALFVHNDDPNRRAEELPCNPLFAAFVADELLPFARAHYRLSTQTGLAGASFGGLASSYIALTYPERFGKVLSQSGSYWWSFPANHPAFDGSDKPGWLRRRFAERPVVNTQFYLGAGIFEGSLEGDGVLEQNRLQRDALRTLGYEVAYQEFAGGHDHLAWRATLPDALIAQYAPGR